MAKPTEFFYPRDLLDIVSILIYCDFNLLRHLNSLFYLLWAFKYHLFNFDLSLYSHLKPVKTCLLVIILFLIFDL